MFILSPDSNYICMIITMYFKYYGFDRGNNLSVYQHIHSKIPALLVLCLLFAGNTHAEITGPLPTIVKQQWQDLEKVGQTRLRRFGFHIYDASFWMIGKGEDDNYTNSICALSITYARDIPASKLLSSTKEEWDRFGFADKYPIDAWLSALEDIWPDVAEGDQLIVVSNPQGETAFFNKDKQLGIIPDAQFGSAFLSIWLAEEAQFSKKRKELLGE